MRLFFRSTFVLFFIAPFISLPANSQINGGPVVDTANQPLHMVSVMLLKDTSIVAAAITNKRGYFELNTSPEKGMRYTLRLTSIGYATLNISFNFPDTQLSTRLVLSPITKTLAEVSVTAANPLVTRRADRYIINVENSVLANGLTATEVLQRSPGIWVDNLGNIRLKGNQPVTVMINDIIQRMSAEELSDFLRSLKSEDIGRIEVMITPPAEMEAEGAGGVVKIFLKKGKKSGWSGSVNTQYWQQQYKPYFTSGLNLSYQFRKLYLSAGYNYVKDLRSITEQVNILYPNHSAYYNATRRFEKIGRQQYRFAASYDINAKHSLSVESIISRTKFFQEFFSDETHTGDTITFTSPYSDKRRVYGLNGITVNYSIALDTVGSTLRFIVDYSSAERSENNYFFEPQVPPAKDIFRRNDAPTDTKIYTAQSDYTKVLSKNITIKTGIKYASISRDNLLITEELFDSSWSADSARSNHFMYQENLLMLYSSIERKIKQLVINVGVRAEETFSDGRVVSAGQHFSKKYFGWFPSIFITHPMNPEKETSLSVAYARRLTRPAMSDLNPTRMVYSKYTALIGNPNLQPEYTNNFSVTYQFLKDHSIDLYLTDTRNSISLSVKPGENNSIDYYSANTASAIQYGLSYSGRISPLKGWTITNNLSGYRSAYQFSGKKYKQNAWLANSLHVFSLEKVGEIDFLAEYRSPYMYSNLYTYGNSTIDVGFTKRLMQGKLRARLSCTDLFNTLRERELTDEDETRFEFYRKRPTRTLRISLTYNFKSGKKVVDKKIDQGNSEERSRGSN